jgi:phospholipid transport system substrate-binding protein
MIWLALVGILFLLPPSPIRAGEPTDEIRSAIYKGLAVLNDESLRANGKNEHMERLREIVRPLFNFKEMARRSLGRHWRDMTPEDRTEFVTVFADLLETTYAEKIDLYRGGDVNFVREVVDEDYARVDSKVKDTKGTDYSVSYKLLREDGDWKIYDVVVENVSLINNYRAQFGRIIRKSSYKELVERIKQKSG